MLIVLGRSVDNKLAKNAKEGLAKITRHPGSPPECWR